MRRHGCGPARPRRHADRLQGRHHPVGPVRLAPGRCGCGRPRDPHPLHRPAAAGLLGRPRGFSEADAIRAVASYREYFAETGIFENAVYPGVPECLEALQARGWRLAVATSKPTVFAERILDHFSLLTHFQAVVGAGLDGSRRHKHEVIAAALSDLGVAADERCIMVGDREHDVIGAKTVGLLSVGVTWGYGSVQELSEAGADVLVHAVAELPAAMERLGRHRLT